MSLDALASVNVDMNTIRPLKCINGELEAFNGLQKPNYLAFTKGLRNPHLMSELYSRSAVRYSPRVASGKLRADDARLVQSSDYCLGEAPETIDPCIRCICEVPVGVSTLP